MAKHSRHLPALLALGLLLGLCLAILGAGEMLVRGAGWRPWSPADPGVQVTPGGRVARLHPTLGYTHLPGRFTVTLADGFTFSMTHGPDTLRITSAVDPGPPDGRPEIWILGCSATHGWSLNDNETYPWLLQEKFPRYRVLNFGVSGYGTLQSLIQFREALATGRPKPRLVILAYGDFHDARNTLARQRRKEVAPWNRLGPLRQPYARLAPNGQLQLAMTDVQFTEFPFMTSSALIDKLESTYNGFEVAFLDSHQVSEALVLQINKLARENGSTFIVAGIWNSALTKDMLEYAEGEHLRALDISVDTRRSEYNNLPHDIHPSALANRRYADQLGNYLTGQGLL